MTGLSPRRRPGSMCLCASSAPTVGRDYLLNAIIGPDGWPDYFVNLHLRVFFVSVSTIFVWVASLMFSLYRRGCFAAISRSKHFRRLRWRKCLMIKEFSGTPRTPSGGFAPCTPLTAENVYRKYNNPRIPSGWLTPSAILFYPCFEGFELLFLLAVLLTHLVEVFA